MASVVVPGAEVVLFFLFCMSLGLVTRQFQGYLILPYTSLLLVGLSVPILLFPVLKRCHSAEAFARFITSYCHVLLLQILGLIVGFMEYSGVHWTYLSAGIQAWLVCVLCLINFF